MIEKSEKIIFSVSSFLQKCPTLVLAFRFQLANQETNRSKVNENKTIIHR